MNMSAFPISHILSSDRLKHEATGQVGKGRGMGRETVSLAVLRTGGRRAAREQGQPGSHWYLWRDYEAADASPNYTASSPGKARCQGNQERLQPQNAKKERREGRKKMNS